MSTRFVLLTLLLTAILAVACEQKGPAEEVGEKIDEAVEDVADAAKEACEEAKKAAGADDTDC